MVGGTIELDDGILPPAGAVEVQSLGQLNEEQKHGSVVRVGLQQREEAVAVIVHRGYYGDSRLNLGQRLRRWEALMLPGRSTVVTDPQPALVNVENTLALFELPEQVGSELLAED